VSRERLDVPLIAEFLEAPSRTRIATFWPKPSWSRFDRGMVIRNPAVSNLSARNCIVASSDRRNAPAMSIAKDYPISCLS